MKKSILVLTTFYKPFLGGAEIFVAEITKRLANDFSLVVLTTRNDRRLPAIEETDGIIVYRLGLGCKYDKLLFPFLVLLKSFFLKFDLVYAVMASYAGAAALFIKIFRGKSYILNLQSGTMETTEYLKIIKLFWPFYKKIHTDAGAVHAISDYLKQRAIKLGAEESKIKVIPHGLDLQLFKTLPLAKHPWRIIAVARLEKVKGINYLLKALPQVLKKFPQAELIIIGDGSQGQLLKNLSQQLNIADKVEWRGLTQHEELPAQLNSGVIFVGPSLAEGFGMVFLEAMACGLAVIGTNVGGISDIIKDKFNGLIVAPANPPALAEAIILLLGNSDFRGRLIVNSQSLLKQYDWNNIAREVKLLL